MTIAAINQSQSGIINLNIPILRAPTFQRIPLEFDNVELDKHMTGTKDFSKMEDVKKIIVSQSSFSTLLPRFNQIFYCEFPDQYALAYNMIYNTRQNQFGILLNKEYTGINWLDKQKKFTFKDVSMLGANILLGCNKISTTLIDDIEGLEEIYRGVCNFIYSLFIRIFAVDVDMKALAPRDFMFIYFAFAKLVANLYFIIEGESNTVALSAIRAFFQNDNIELHNLPINYHINDYIDVFKLLNSNNIIPGTSVEKFRDGVADRFGSQAILAMVSGIELVSYIASVKAGGIFNDNVATVHPKSVDQINKALIKFNQTYKPTFDQDQNRGYGTFKYTIDPVEPLDNYDNQKTSYIEEPINNYDSNREQIRHNTYQQAKTDQITNGVQGLSGLAGF